MATSPSLSLLSLSTSSPSLPPAMAASRCCCHLSPLTPTLRTPPPRGTLSVPTSRHGPPRGALSSCHVNVFRCRASSNSNAEGKEGESANVRAGGGEGERVGERVGEREGEREGERAGERGGEREGERLGERGIEWERELEKVMQSEESRKLLADFRAAAMRVADAQAALEAVEREERERARERESVGKWEAQAREALAEMDASEREVALAGEELKAAGIALIEARAGLNGPSVSYDGKWSTEGVDEAKEKVESVKAAAVAGLSGALIGWPFIFLTSEIPLGINSLISAASVLITCVLFGVTYRYVVRKDLGNFQLKAGAVGAFALVRGLAQVDTTQALLHFPSSPSLEAVLLSSLNAGEGVIVLAFCALALEYCLKEGVLKPFPTQRDDQ